MHNRNTKDDDDIDENEVLKTIRIMYVEWLTDDDDESFMASKCEWCG